MKRTLLLFLLSFALLGACAPKQEPVPTPVPTPSPAPTPDNRRVDIPFTARCYAGATVAHELTEIIITTIESVDELYAHCGKRIANEESFLIEDNYPGSSIYRKFADVMAPYNETFFQTHMLIVLDVKEPNYGYTHRVLSLGRGNDGSLEINLLHIARGGSEAEQFRLVLIDVAKEGIDPDKITGRNAWEPPYSDFFTPEFIAYE